MPCMIWLAALVEATIQNWEDFGVLVAIQFLNASLSYYETVKADDAVAALKASLKPQAVVKRDGRTQVKTEPTYRCKQLSIIVFLLCVS